MGIVDKTLDLIFPPRCMICLDIMPFDGPRWLCGECIGLLEPITGAVCKRCGAPSENEVCAECLKTGRNDSLDGNCSVFAYDDTVKRLIYNFKYLNHPEIARGLGALLQSMDMAFLQAMDYLTYVPLHRHRHTKRGYNQAKLLAHELSKITGVPLINILIRKKDTKPQSQLDYISRIYNMEGALAVKSGHDIKSKTITVVDDIYTTGITLNACAEALKLKGAKRVTGFTLAIALKDY